MKKIILILVMIVVLAGAVSAFNCGIDTVQDIEDNTYNTIQIGGQCWMKENMRTTTYPDGTSITKGCATHTGCDGTGVLLWGDDTALYSCPPNAANNGEDCNGASTLGMLYQWSAAMDGSTTAGAQGICPNGWHIPTHDEWTTLELEVCTSETCATDFPYDTTTTNWRGTNEGTALKSGESSGFEALFVGYRTNNGAFSNRGTSIYLRTSTEWPPAYVWARSLHQDFTTVYRHGVNVISGFSIRCLKNSETQPTYTTFTSEETTNFSEGDVTNITSLTLAINNKGKIAFPSNHSINAENADYDTNVKIEDAMIYVNSAALDSSFNDSATLTFYNVDCNKPYVFYSETASTFASILSENQRCPESLCSNIQCTDSTLTVDVEHFTGFAAGTDANLTIEAEAGIKYALDSIDFYTWYINSTDGTPISGECNISFDDAWGTWFEMDYNGSEYNYTKSSGFAAAGTHDYNVTCSSANFVTLEANDTKIVSPTDIPEFSAITLGLGLIAVLGGLFVIRKKK